ncbi:hypothetical protein [Streptomyces sp. NPDC056921]|uniref:hypothetical protein n=1 Tax=Streptomyces sp. NPDC056921 TaxID=3345966 RepID=UPI003630DE16
MLIRPPCQRALTSPAPGVVHLNRDFGLLCPLGTLGRSEHRLGQPRLDLAAALALARQETWAAAHSQFAAQPTPDRPDGAIIATTAPKRWEGEPVRVLDLNT